MSQTPFDFHVVPADWGRHIPDCDFTIGRGSDPRTGSGRELPIGPRVEDRVSVGAEEKAGQAPRAGRSNVE